MKLGVLLSGSGRTLRNLIDRIADGRLRGVAIAVVVASKPDAGGVGIAAAAGIPVYVEERRRYNRAAEFSSAVTRHLRQHGVELVLLAGWIYRYQFPPDFEGRVLNIHPALLPKFGGKGFYGRRVHEAVLAAGESESGCTVHFADLEYDHGPAILQRKVPVFPGDTPESLAERVFEQECEAYPEAIQRVASGQIRLVGGKIVSSE